MTGVCVALGVGVGYKTSSLRASRPHAKIPNDTTRAPNAIQRFLLTFIFPYSSSLLTRSHCSRPIWHLGRTGRSPSVHLLTPGVSKEPTHLTCWQRSQLTWR